MRDELELGMDRTVAVTWAPDDTWPAFVEGMTGLADDDMDAEVVAVASVGSEDDPARTDDAGYPVDGRSDAWRREPVEAVAAVDGHPLHPALVPLPIGAFVGALACDLAYTRTHDRFWARGAHLLTGAGIVTGLAAGSLGALDFGGRPQIRRRPSAWLHAGGNLAVLGLAGVSEVLRARDERAAVARGALAISALSAVLLAATGWLGGELAFRDRIGVTTH
jgi:uncharacterized membrane protein